MYKRQACGDDRQIVVTEHCLSVPVVHDGSKEPARIDVYFSIVEEVNKDDDDEAWFRTLQSQSPQQRATSYVQKAALSNAKDLMLYLQGGPGFGAPTPVVGLGFSKESSWGAAALSKFQRIVLMDQRGTGRSTPITKQSLQERFPDLFVLDDAAAGEGGAISTLPADLEGLKSSKPAEVEKFEAALNEATDYLAQFRADNIVRDAELIKDVLMLPSEPGEVRMV